MTRDDREIFMELYERLEDDDEIMRRVQQMISYREKKLALVQMKMEEKIQFMKETNVISIIKFMQKTSGLLMSLI